MTVATMQSRPLWTEEEQLNAVVLFLADLDQALKNLLLWCRTEFWQTLLLIIFYHINAILPSSPQVLFCLESILLQTFRSHLIWRNSCKTHYIHIDYMVIILHIIVDTMLPFTLADNLAKAVKKPEVGHLGRSTSPLRGRLFYTSGEFLTVINVSAAFRSEVQINPWLEEPIKTNQFHTGSSTTSLASACTRPGPHCPPCDWKRMERIWSCSWSWPLRTFRYIFHQWTIYTILFLQWYTAN